jgi:hypothetical protein
LSDAVISTKLPGVDIECHAPRLTAPSDELPDIEVSQFNDFSNANNNIQNDLKERFDLAEQLLSQNPQLDFSQGYYQGNLFFSPLF